MVSYRSFQMNSPRNQVYMFFTTFWTRPITLELYGIHQLLSRKWHIIYKDAVSFTNKQNLQHDLTAFKNTMQAIHFTLKGYIPIDQASPGDGFRQLLRSGL